MSYKEGARGSIEDRMSKRIAIDDETKCWNWTGAISNTYGSIYYQGRMQKAHRVMWVLRHGEVPAGKQLDHLCRNRSCCNPNHLEVVTQSENLRRSPLMDRKSHKTHCPRGHEYSGDNLLTRPNGWRTCRKCMRQHQRNWRARCEATL